MQELRRLTSLRWYAALLVYLLHVDGMFEWRPLRVFSFGQTGVTFFFVLSGFVLTWSMREGDRARDFYVRRFARIYPSMLVSLLLCVAAAAVWPWLGFKTGALGLVTCLLAVQAWFPGGYPVYAYNGPAWSLSVEAFFYALFPWFIRPLDRMRAHWQIALAIAALGVTAGLTIMLSRAGHGSDVAYNNPAVRFGEFLLGVVLALLMRSGWRPRVPVWVAVVVVGFAAVVARKTPFFPLEDYVMVLPFGLLIVAAAREDVAGHGGWLTSAWAVYLGRLSFCFYLVHQSVSESIVRAVHWDHHWSLIEGVTPLAATFVASLVAAAGLHHGVEVPFERRLRKRWRSRVVDLGAAGRVEQVERQPDQRVAFPGE